MYTYFAKVINSTERQVTEEVVNKGVVWLKVTEGIQFDLLQRLYLLQKKFQSTLNIIRISKAMSFKRLIYYIFQLSKFQ